MLLDAESLVLVLSSESLRIASSPESECEDESCECEPTVSSRACEAAFLSVGYVKCNPATLQGLLLLTAVIDTSQMTLY